MSLYFCLNFSFSKFFVTVESTKFSPQKQRVIRLKSRTIMTIKLKKYMLNRLNSQFHLTYGHGLAGYFELYETLFSHLGDDKINNEIIKAYHHPTFLYVDEVDIVKTGYFLNNFSLLWMIVSQTPPLDYLLTEKFPIFEIKDETIESDALFFETLDLISQHAKALKNHDYMYPNLKNLIDKQQCLRLFNQNKFTQKLFLSLIDISSSTFHNNKAMA